MTLSGCLSVLYCERREVLSVLNEMQLAMVESRLFAQTLLFVLTFNKDEVHMYQTNSELA